MNEKLKGYTLWYQRRLYSLLFCLPYTSLSIKPYCSFYFIFYYVTEWWFYSGQNYYNALSRSCRKIHCDKHNIGFSSNLYCAVDGIYLLFLWYAWFRIRKLVIINTNRASCIENNWTFSLLVNGCKGMYMNSRIK